jgi:hypothetical protein
VLRRFGMLDYKSMTTPMISNLKKLHDQATSSDPEDPTIYPSDYWVLDVSSTHQTGHLLCSKYP